MTTEVVDLKNYIRKKDLKKDKNEGVNLKFRSKPIGNCRVVKNEPLNSDNYSQYLCFPVFCSTNKLVFKRNEHLWSEEQQKTHDNINLIKVSRIHKLFIKKSYKTRKRKYCHLNLCILPRFFKILFKILNKTNLFSIS